jgi:hypothetical protein
VREGPQSFFYRKGKKESSQDEEEKNQFSQLKIGQNIRVYLEDTTSVKRISTHKPVEE